MTDASFSKSEMMIVAAARELAGQRVCFVGVGLPNIAVNLAQRTVAPELELVYEAGVFGARPARLPLSIGDPTIVTGAIATRAIGVKSRTASYGNFLYRAELMACVPTVPMSNVRPSGADLATVSAPNEPPAPPRLSITTTDLSVSPNICANGRATMSVGPPAGNGTTRRICRPAIDCAAAFLGSDTKLMATALTARKATRLINPSKLS
jgi:hypothetical protein